VRRAGWSDLVQGLLLLFILLAGVYALFLFWRRQSRLYQQQREFITQVTHELKSPLASIQLHLETIRLRRPPEERLNAFVETMLDDTRRLQSQIENLLLMARLEQRRRPSDLREIDLSAFVTRYLDENRDRLPPGTRLEIQVEKDIRAAVEPDEMGTVLRNLLENAVLYSPDQPEISVRLVRDGRYAMLSVTDRGQGVSPDQLKKYFNVFTGLSSQMTVSVVLGLDCISYRRLRKIAAALLRQRAQVRVGDVLLPCVCHFWRKNESATCCFLRHL